MSNQIKSLNVSVRDMSQLAVVADVQYRDPFASPALNRRLAGVLPHGVYSGFNVVPAGGRKVKVTSGTGLSAALVNVGKGFQVKITQQKDITLSVSTGIISSVVIEAFYDGQTVTNQVDPTVTKKAVEIKAIAKASVTKNHVVLCDIDLTKNPTTITNAHISFGSRNQNHTESFFKRINEDTVQSINSHIMVANGKYLLPEKNDSSSIGDSTKSFKYGFINHIRSKAIASDAASLKDKLSLGGGAITDEVLSMKASARSGQETLYASLYNKDGKTRWGYFGFTTNENTTWSFTNSRSNGDFDFRGGNLHENGSRVYTDKRPPNWGAIGGNHFLSISGDSILVKSDKWLKAASNNVGFLPFSNGQSFVGRKSNQFKEMWSKGYYGEKIAVTGLISGEQGHFKKESPADQLILERANTNGHVGITFKAKDSQIKFGTTLDGLLGFTDRTDGNISQGNILYSTKNKPQVDDVSGSAVAKYASIQTGRGDWTTAEFIAWLKSKGALKTAYWMCRGSWDYANNRVLKDTKLGNIDMAGATIEVMGQEDSFTIRIHTARATRTDSGAIPNATFIYTANSTLTGWRRLYSTGSKPNWKDIGGENWFYKDGTQTRVKSGHLKASDNNSGFMPAETRKGSGSVSFLGNSENWFKEAWANSLRGGEVNVDALVQGRLLRAKNNSTAMGMHIGGAKNYTEMTPIGVDGKEIWSSGLRFINGHWTVGGGNKLYHEGNKPNLEELGVAKATRFSFSQHYRRVVLLLVPYVTSGTSAGHSGVFGTMTFTRNDGGTRSEGVNLFVKSGYDQTSINLTKMGAGWSWRAISVMYKGKPWIALASSSDNAQNADVEFIGKKFFARGMAGYDAADQFKVIPYRELKNGATTILNKEINDSIKSVSSSTHSMRDKDGYQFFSQSYLPTLDQLGAVARNSISLSKKNMKDLQYSGFYNGNEIVGAPNAAYHNIMVMEHGNYLKSYLAWEHRTKNFRLGWQESRNSGNPTWYDIYHSGNLPSTGVLGVFSKTESDGRYFKRSGGEVTGKITAKSTALIKGGSTIGGNLDNLQKTALVVDAGGGILGIDGNEIFSNIDLNLGSFSNTVMLQVVNIVNGQRKAYVPLRATKNGIAIEGSITGARSVDSKALNGWGARLIDIGSLSVGGGKFINERIIRIGSHANANIVRVHGTGNGSDANGNKGNNAQCLSVWANGKDNFVYNEAYKPHLSTLPNSVKLDLKSLSNTKFYPVSFQGQVGGIIDFCIASPSYGGGHAHNSNTIMGFARGGGWSDYREVYHVVCRKYDDTETTIHSIHKGNEGFSGIVIYIRGGYEYNFRSYATPKLHTSDFSYGGSVFKAGVTTPGSGNTKTTPIVTFDRGGVYTNVPHYKPKMWDKATVLGTQPILELQSRNNSDPAGQGLIAFNAYGADSKDIGQGVQIRYSYHDDPKRPITSVPFGLHIEKTKSNTGGTAQKAFLNVEGRITAGGPIGIRDGIGFGNMGHAGTTSNTIRYPHETIQLNSNHNLRIYFGNQERFYLTNTGDLTLTRNFLAKGNVTAYSDKRIKKNIKKIKGALGKVTKLNGVTFDRTDVDLRQTGLIAQDVEKVLPEAVITTETEEIKDLKSVNYGSIVGLLVEAIKELKAEVEALKNDYAI